MLEKKGYLPQLVAPMTQNPLSCPHGPPLLLYVLTSNVLRGWYSTTLPVVPIHPYQREPEAAM
eukprot:767376-Hanusia_phi.AAC.1